MTATTPRSQTFDDALWAAAQGGQAPESLRALVTATFRGDRDQLTVSTVITDAGDPAERLAQAGGAAVTGFAWAGPIGVLRVGDGSSAYTVAVWPAAEEGVYHLMGTV